MKRKLLFLASGLCLAVGCNRNESTTATPPNSGTGATGMASVPGGAELTGPEKFGPNYHSDPAGAPNEALGKPRGNGFRELTANQSGGMGTGLQGFNDVGASGTSGAITDTHHIERGDESTAGTGGAGSAGSSGSGTTTGG